MALLWPIMVKTWACDMSYNSCMGFLCTVLWVMPLFLLWTLLDLYWAYHLPHPSVAVIQIVLCLYYILGGRSNTNSNGLYSVIGLRWASMFYVSMLCMGRAYNIHRLYVKHTPNLSGPCL
jgi:hypothetical protein